MASSLIGESLAAHDSDTKKRKALSIPVRDVEGFVVSG
jgi:hypothetical protein